MRKKNKLTQTEIKILAVLCSPVKEFADKYGRESHIKGFMICASFMQMLGWEKNEAFFERVKMQLKNKVHTSDRMKKKVHKHFYQRKQSVKSGNSRGLINIPEDEAGGVS